MAAVLKGIVAHSGKASFALAFFGSVSAFGQPLTPALPAPAASAASATPPAAPVPSDDAAKPAEPPAGLPGNAARAGTADASELEALKRDVLALKSELDEVRVNGAESASSARKLDIYGFTDMGLQRVWYGRRSGVAGTGSPGALTFVLGNVNLYFDATPVPGWRGLTEVRLTNYPDGALRSPAVPALNVPEDRVSTTVFDVNAPGPGWNEVRWGSIVLEQAWIQGSASDFLNVRVGYFLTPFGIWSIDHGTPTLIALDRPQFTRGRSFPDHLLGVQVLGQVMHRSWTYGYVAYVSNGRTSGSLDVTDDKAFGGRLTATTTRPVRLTLGLSGYGGRYSQKVIEASPTNALALEEREVVGYTEWDIGADVSLDVGDFRLRSEGVLERLDYRPGHRDAVLGLPGTQWPDRTVWAYYVLAAYQLPWWGLEPYASGEVFRYPTQVAEGALIPGVGLNIHFSTEVQLKTQFARAHFLDFNGKSRGADDTTMVASRLVLAF